MEVDVFKLGIGGSKSDNDLIAYVKVNDAIKHLT